MKFSESHEWIQVQGDIGVVGISDVAQKELGEVVYVELPAVGKKVKAGEQVAVLESTKAAADVYTPVSGEVIEINQMLVDFVERINSSSEKEGWLFKIKITHPEELDTLLTRQQYFEMVKT